MTVAAKILGRMRNNPAGWRIEELKTVADRFKIEYRQPGDKPRYVPASLGSKAYGPGAKTDQAGVREEIPRADR